MQNRQIRALAIAFAVVSAAVLGNPRTGSADILVTVTDGTGQSATSYTYDTASNQLAQFSVQIGSYTLTGETVFSNYPGGPANGSISTTVDVLSTSTSGPLEQLTVQVQLVASGTSDNLLWTGPSYNPLSVSAGSSLTPNSNVTSGTVTTNTYFNSTSSTTTTGLGASTIGVTSYAPPGSTSASNYVNVPTTASTYTLSQTVTLSGAVDGYQAGFSFGATSVVTAAEPSGLLIAGIGGLGLIGYGLRRRNALGD